MWIINKESNYFLCKFYHALKSLHISPIGLYMWNFGGRGLVDFLILLIIDMRIGWRVNIPSIFFIECLINEWQKGKEKEETLEGIDFESVATIVDIDPHLNKNTKN